MAAISAAENHEVILLEGNERIGKKLFITGKGRCNVTNAKDISEFFDFIPGNPHFLYSALYLLEGNERIGKKLFITGKGRCNVTNAKDISEFFDFIPGNPHFLYSALYTYTNIDVMNFFENAGVKLKVERGSRVFPNSDKSSDIISGLSRGLNEATYTNIDVMNFFENAGVKLKVERGSRVFPNSDKSSDIISGLSRGLNEAGVDLRLHSKVKDVIFNNNKIEAVILENGSKVKGDYFIITTGGKSYPLTVDLRLHSKVKDVIFNNNKIEAVILENGSKVKGDYFIITTGGKSYPLTGSTGIGFDLAKKMGHTIVEPKPSLVPIEIEESWVRELQGLSLRNIEVRELQGLSLRNIELKIKNKKNSKVVYSGQGEMLFTHFGISGPLVLSGSRFIKDGEKFEISLDLKPALEEKQLDLRIQKDFKKNLNKDFKNSLDELLPKKLIPVIIELSKIDENKKVNSITKEERTITKEERRTLLNLLKNLTFTVKGLRDIAEAIVTAGGVSTKEIDPSTMQSKIVDNLYFAGEVIDVDAFTGGYNVQTGEVIDVDAFTGGYNVQIALSTGYLAGKSI